MRLDVYKNFLDRHLASGAVCLWLRPHLCASGAAVIALDTETNEQILLGVHLSLCQTVCLSIYLLDYLSMYLSTYPTCRSRHQEHGRASGREKDQRRAALLSPEDGRPEPHQCARGRAQQCA